ncbi:MAG: winged helix DNA-binding domain-containing protein [Acidimicrobiales bacterium]
MDAVPTLSPRQLNRTVLTRQLLLQRSRGSLPQVLEATAGIQAQYAPSMYIGLWSRVEGFERDHLNSALVDRSVVQGTLMRATIHLVSKDDYWPFELAVRAPRRAWWLRSQRAGVAVADLQQAAAVVRTELQNGPVSHAELAARVGPASLMALHVFTDLVRVPPSGTWERRRANIYAAAEDWVGPEPELDAGDAVDHMVRRYLSAFGPARPKDIAAWAGLPLTEIRASLRRIEIHPFRSDEGDDLVDLVDLVIAAAETPAPVRFLPTWDTTLLAHARRAGVLLEEDRGRIFHVKNPQSEATFLVDGVVGGTWRHDGERVTYETFRPLDKRARIEVEEEAARLGGLFDDAR